MRRPIRLIVLASGVMALAALSLPASATHNMDEHSPNMAELFNLENGRDMINSDMAFWGNHAFQGDYGGFRIFDISNPASPSLVVNFACFGPQNDITVWDRDGNGQADILFTSVDSVLEGPACGSAAAPAAEVEQPDNWEGIRIFDISNPASPTLIGNVYQDCGSHTHTLWPDPGRNRVLLYNSSYSLRNGPTCGPNTAPANPLHGKIQVVEVSWNAANPLGPVTAAEIAEPAINYPGDPDNLFDPQEHGLPAGFGDLRACHDISVFVPLRLAAAACAEQAQVWRVGANGIPDTANPLWVYDDTTDETGTTGNVNDTGVVVDFWHSSTFSWDGQIVHFEDESFGLGCPPITTAPVGGDTGRMFFFDQAGNLLSTFMSPMPWETDYCSAHLGNVVPATDKNLLVFAWYMGGTTVIDFTNPAAPSRAAHYDGAGGTGPAGPDSYDNWAAYWYEGPALPGNSLTIYATDGVHDPLDDPPGGGARGFLSLRADIAANEIPLDHLNPQTQDAGVLGPGGFLSCKGKPATLVGTNGNDVLVGTAGEDVVVGLGGNDRIKTGNGNDTICAGGGKDRVRAGNSAKGGFDLVLGEGGRDKLFGQGGADRLRGGGGKDLIKAGSGPDRLAGQNGNDQLRGQGGADKMNGGPGRDLCNGGAGQDTATKCERVQLVP